MSLRDFLLHRLDELNAERPKTIDGEKALRAAKLELLADLGRLTTAWQ